MKGVLTNYLSSLSEEQLVKNTLTGFLIYLLREKGALSIEEVSEYVEEKYSTLRKPSGKLYSSDMKRSLKSALSSNKLFE
jgi:hypothetical protein